MSRLETLKRSLIGSPLASHESEGRRIGKVLALAVFSSDAISSTAYATEEILHVLVPKTGLTVALSALVPIALVVCALLAVVVFSYSQTIHSYPDGGGSYVVSRENLGRYPSLTAGGALLVDYVLTVAVSVSAGVAAITSASEGLSAYRVPLCVGFVVLLTVVNLRGLRESSRVFAAPTYIYITILAALIVWGLFRSATGHLTPIPHADEGHEGAGAGLALIGLTPFLLARAFSSGAVALTGVEAISNGVPAFKRPSSRNATMTLTAMAVILGAFFLGISVLTTKLGPTPFDPSSSNYQTLLSQLGDAVFGRESPLYVVLQASTAMILLLAANTAYADFPRLASIIASDGYLPRQMANLGDRLVFSNGVVFLAIAAAILLVAFGGDTTRLIPLYAVGVFTSFTLGQSGMVVHHRRLKHKRWRTGVAINTLGAVATGAVLLIVLISKFTIGAWIPAMLMPLLIVVFVAINKHYSTLAAKLSTTTRYEPVAIRHAVVLLVGRLHGGTFTAIDYVRSLNAQNVAAFTVVTNQAEEDAMTHSWALYDVSIPLVIVRDPYRNLSKAILGYLGELDRKFKPDITTVVLPEFVDDRWWLGFLHNQSALALKIALRFRRKTVVASVPFHISDVPTPDEDKVG